MHRLLRGFQGKILRSFKVAKAAIVYEILRNTPNLKKKAINETIWLRLMLIALLLQNNLG